MAKSAQLQAQVVMTYDADMTRSFTDIESNLALIDDREKLLHRTTRRVEMLTSAAHHARHPIDEQLDEGDAMRIADLTKRLPSP